MGYLRFLPMSLIFLLPTCATPERPQTPRPPFDYEVRSVVVPIDGGSGELKGTLTLPSGKRDFPVVILVGGSGPNNRDEEWNGHKPFLVMADYLTRRGIAVLRLDDRDYDKSAMKFYGSTTADFSRDLSAAADFLRGLDETAEAPLGLIGHSEGGIVCAMTASERNDIAFLILLGTPGFPLETNTLLAAEASYVRNGVPKEERERLMRFHREYARLVSGYEDDRQAREEAKALYDSYFKGTPAWSRRDRRDLITKITLPWFRYMNRNDPSEYLKKITVPVLAVAGDLDTAVPPDENLTAIGESLAAAGNSRVKTVELPNMNHMLQPADSFLPYEDINETISPSLLKLLGEWILDRKEDFHE